MTTVNPGSASILANEIQKSFQNDNRIDRKELAQLKELINNSDLSSDVKASITNILDKSKDASYTFFGIFKSNISDKEMRNISQDLNQLKSILGDNQLGQDLVKSLEEALTPPQQPTQENGTDSSNVQARKSHDSNPVSEFFSNLFRPRGSSSGTASAEGTSPQPQRTGLLRNDVSSFHLTQYTGANSQNGDCGPTSGAMILRSFGIDASVQDVRNSAPGKPSGPPWALSEDQIASSLSRLSNGQVTQSGDTNVYSPSKKDELINDIRSQLSEGKMLMLCTGVRNDDWNSRHYVVITGIDDNGNIQYADPAINQNGSGPAYMTPEELLLRMDNAKDLGRTTTLTAFQRN